MESGGSTSSGNLYAQMNEGDEFLRSPILTNAYAEGDQVFVQFLGVMELNPVATERARGVRIRCDVINIYGLVGTYLARSKRLSKDQRIGLTRTHGTRVNAHGFWEVTKKAVGRFEMGNVDRIGIGKQPEAVGFGEVLEQTVRENRVRIQSGIPDLGELVEIERNSQALAQIQVPIASRHPAFLPVRPVRVLFDCGPKFFGGKGETLGEAELRLANIHPDEDAANIKDDGAKFAYWSHLLSTLGTAADPAGCFA